MATQTHDHGPRELTGATGDAGGRGARVTREAQSVQMSRVNANLY